MCWRKGLDSIQKRMECVMKNNIQDISHDVTFIVGEEREKISCHKIFLAIASPVFEAMFSKRHCVHDDDNNQVNDNGDPSAVVKHQDNEENAAFIDGSEIHITDVNPIGFNNIIRYAYTGTLDYTVKDAIITMHVADKYDIPEIVEHCAEVMQKDLSVENTVTIYQTAVLFNKTKLAEKSWEFIKRNACKLLESQQILEFSEDNLCNFLRLDHMRDLKSEVNVFNATLKWGKLRCVENHLDPSPKNIRDVLEKAVSLIRFPVIKPIEFNDFVIPSGILNAEECIKILMYFTESGKRREELGKTINYSCKRRFPETVEVLFCTATSYHDTHLEFDSQSASKGFSTFRVNGNTEKIRLKSVGFVLAPQLIELTTGQITIELYDDATDELIDTTTERVSKLTEIVFIEFDKALNIKPNTKYNVWINRNEDYFMKPVRVAQYKTQFSRDVNFLPNSDSGMPLLISFTPGNNLVWALRFECDSP